ncbi:MAG: thioredoxin family protein [Ignavibacteriaceae bacterium]|jgi:hypothetical protein|nr:thioredoxin family protein [Ignavibacteriaceae bacterium]
MLKPNLSVIKSFISYDEYKKQFKQQVSVNDVNSLSENDREYFEYRKLNFQRTSRVEKTFTPSEETNKTFSSITDKQKWFVITESWCGDSAQSLPVIASLAALSDKIEFNIVLRDLNSEFMSLYLTNGGKSIPKLIVFDKDGRELFNWGPRPEDAQALFNNLKEQGKDKTEIITEIHLWYAKNSGKEVEKEITELIQNVS